MGQKRVVVEAGCSPRAPAPADQSAVLPTRCDAPGPYGVAMVTNFRRKEVSSPRMLHVSRWSSPSSRVLSRTARSHTVIASGRAPAARWALARSRRGEGAGVAGAEDPYAVGENALGRFDRAVRAGQVAPGRQGVRVVVPEDPSGVADHGFPERDGPFAVGGAAGLPCLAPLQQPGRQIAAHQEGVRVVRAEDAFRVGEDRLSGRDGPFALPALRQGGAS